MDKSVEHFSDEIDRLVDRFRMEYNLSFAKAVGVLEMKKWLLCSEAEENSDNA